MHIQNEAIYAQIKTIHKTVEADLSIIILFHILNIVLLKSMSNPNHQVKATLDKGYKYFSEGFIKDINGKFLFNTFLHHIHPYTQLV